MATKKKKCSACGGYHQDHKELMDCHQRHKDAATADQETKPKKDPIPDEPQQQEKPITPDDMEEYQKIPLNVKAIQWFPGMNVQGVLTGKDRPNYYLDDKGNECRFSEDQAWIGTLEGGHVVNPGDWIVVGTAGEMYPVKESIFPQIYTKPENAQAAQQDQKGAMLLSPELCPEELGFISQGMYAALRVEGFMTEKGFRIENIRHER